MPICELYDVYRGPLSLTRASRNSCRFHKAPHKFESSEVAPEGLCPEVYYLAYPYLFAIVYGAKLRTGKGEGFQFTCPNADAPVKFEVIKTKLSPHDRIKNVVKKVISPFFHIAMMHSGIDLKVIDIPDSLPLKCPHSSVKKGRVYHINFGQFNNLCPAAFRSLFPYTAINYLRKKENRGILTDLVACPDHRKNLIFDISNKDIKKSGHDSEKICHVTEDINIQTIKDSSFHIENREIFSIGDIMKGLNSPCPILLNIGIPYYLTLYHKGKLGFYTYNSKSAIIQCPNTDKRVTAEVILEDSKIKFKILEIAGGHKCPHDIKPGDSYELPVNDKTRYIVEQLNLLILYSILAEESANPIIIKNIADQSQFKIVRSK